MVSQRTVVIVQARMGSSRFPGKVLADIAGKPMLSRVIDRASLSGLPVIVATSHSSADDAIVGLCDELGVVSFRGSELDVLGRYHRAAVRVGADVIVRITADCPLLDPGLIQSTVIAREKHGLDYASNVYPIRTHPQGFDVEVLTAKTLAWLDRYVSGYTYREHVTLYIRERPSYFSIRSVSKDAKLPFLNFSVDEPEDISFPRRVYMDLGDEFNWRDVVDYTRDTMAGSQWGGIYD